MSPDEYEARVNGDRAALRVIDEVKRENARLRDELAELQKECGTAIRKSLNEITYREMAEVEADKWLRLCTEWSEANVKLILRADKAEAELTAAKEKYLQVCAQHGRLVDQVYEEDGETLKHVAAEAELASYKLWAEVEMADLREDLSDHIRMAKDAQEELAAIKGSAT